MTSSVTAIHSVSEAKSGQPAVTREPASKTPEDTVELSDFAKSAVGQRQGEVEDLVKAAASGDLGALALLTVI